MAASKPPGVTTKVIAPLLLKASSATAKAPPANAPSVTVKAAPLVLKANGAALKPSNGAAAKAAPRSAKAKAAAAHASAPKGMTGNQYRDLIASYIHHNYASQGLVVYVEI